jgi:hypothetical protein
MESLTLFPPAEGDFLLRMTVAPLKKIERLRDLLLFYETTSWPCQDNLDTNNGISTPTPSGRPSGNS